jgi:alpha-1,2-mannosyltransferase
VILPLRYSDINSCGGLGEVTDRLTRGTGFHASTEEEYADGFYKALTLPLDEMMAMRRRARESAKRFTDRSFDQRWLANMGRLVGLQAARATLKR